MQSREIEEAINLLDKVESFITDSTIKNQIREYIRNYIEKENTTEIIHSYSVVTAPPYSSQIWFKETNEEYMIVIYQQSLTGNFSSEIRFNKNKAEYLKNFIREIENRINS